MSKHLRHKNNFYISKSFLEELGVSMNSVNSIFKRKKKDKIIINARAYIKYDAIPAETQKKLPRKMDLEAEYNLVKHEQKLDTFFEGMTNAYQLGYTQHVEPYKAKFPTLERKKINRAAQLHEVWQYILDNAGSDCLALFNAFNKVYPGKYKSYNSFANAKSKAVKNGAEFMAIDQRWFTTPLNKKEVGVMNQFWCDELIAMGAKYSNANIWRKLCALCAEKNIGPPSLSWVDKYRKDLLEKNIVVFEGRYGRQKTQATQGTFISMDRVKHANTQWQMDGWDLPFYVKGEKLYERHVLMVIMDVHSRKIVGSAVGRSENTIVIMAALRDAIINTGSLPNEIVSDFHSFHQTKEAAYFKEAILELGTKFVVTSNPQWKSIIERHNSHLGAVCHDFYGYTGKGIKSKSNDAQPKQELLNEYGKNQYNAESIKALGIKVVMDFNDTVLRIIGSTPNAAYENSTKPHAFLVNLSERIKILTPQTELIVRRGQITIKRGIEKFEYSLPTSLATLNNKTVKVRYEDLNQGIYLYEKETDKFIADLIPKSRINGAAVYQTEDDILILNKSKGKSEGRKLDAKKELDKRKAAAMAIDPDCVDQLDRMKQPKDILKILEQDKLLRDELVDKGVKIEKITVLNEKYGAEKETTRTNRKVNESPLQPPKDHKMIKIPRDKPYDYD